MSNEISIMLEFIGLQARMTVTAKVTILSKSLTNCSDMISSRCVQVAASIAAIHSVPWLHKHKLKTMLAGERERRTGRWLVVTHRW